VPGTGKAAYDKSAEGTTEENAAIPVVSAVPSALNIERPFMNPRTTYGAIFNHPFGIIYY
jgi:hypothetical protein